MTIAASPRKIIARPAFALALGAILAVAGLVGLAAPASATTPPELLWTAHANGPDSKKEKFAGAAVHDGHLHLVGTTVVDYWHSFLTVKIGPDGQEIWRRIYEGFTGPQQPDEAADVVVDAAGNVYVTGWSKEGSFPGFIDVVVLKYSPDGDLLWEARHRTPGANAQPGAMVLAPDSHLYVSGAAWDGDEGFDVLLLKYDLDGGEVWSTRHDGPGGLWDAGLHLAVDGAGDVVVGGYTEVLSNDLAMGVFKFDAQGDLLWERVINGFATSEEVDGLVIDATDHIYLVGELAEPGGNQDLVTVKLTPAGEQLWIDRVDGAGPAGESAAGIALAPGGDVVVAGKIWDDAGHRMVVRRLTPAGGVVFTEQIDAGYAAAVSEGVAVDAQGNAYATGFGYDTNGREDWITARLSPTGAVDWLEIYAAPEGRGDEPDAVIVHGDDVWVAGTTWRDYANDDDLTGVRYRQQQATAVGDRTPRPGLELTAFPNPFNPRTTLSYAVASSGHLRLTVHDLRGRHVVTLVDGRRAAGEHAVTWDGRREDGRAAAAGVYLVRIQGAGSSQAAKITLVE